MEVLLMNKRQLSSWQFAFFIFYTTFSLYTGISSYLLIKQSGIHSFFSILITYLLGFIAIMLFFFIFRYRSNENILEKNIFLFGKILGTILNLMISILLLFMGMTLFYHISDFVISQFLDQTPISLFMIVFGILIIYCVKRGIVTVARVGVIFLFIILLSNIVFVMGLIPHMHPSSLMPFIDSNKFKTILINSGEVFAINIVPIFILLIIKKNKISTSYHLKRRILLLYTISFGILILENIFTIGTLGIYLARIEQFPEYMVLQKINLFQFLDRIEKVICIQWVLSSFILLVLIIYHICKLFPKTSFRKSSFGVVSIMLLMSLLIFRNNTYFYYFVQYYFPIVCFSLFAIYILIGITIFTREYLK